MPEFNCLSLLPTITAFIAFILSLLCLFAGTKTNFLTGTDILTLYTPIGNGTGIHDFYSIYVMSYCTGYMGDDGLGKNLTGCSGHDLLFSFNPSRVLQHESGNDTNLADLGWPTAISDDFQTFSITNQAMGVLYVVGAGIAGIAMLIRLGLLITRRGRQSIFEVASLLLGFICLGIASIIATVLGFQFVHLVNAHGRESNVTAKYGEQFLSMSWASTGLMLVSSITSSVFLLVDHRRSRGYVPPIEHDDDHHHYHEAADETDEQKILEDSESDRMSKASKRTAA